MAVPVILVDAQPRSAADGTVRVVALAGGGAVLPYPPGYRAGVAALPTISAVLEFDEQEMGGGGVPQAAALRFAPSGAVALAEVADLYWTDAMIAVRIGAEDVGAPPVVLAGTVLETTVANGGLQIALADPATDLKRPIIVDRFGGTGGIEGPADLAGVPKARSWGRCFNVAGKLLDPAHIIYCFGDPSRRLAGFDAVRDRGALATPATLTVLAWQGSVEATFAALRAAPATQGGGVLAPDIACIKWWTEPSDLTADLRGEVAAGYVETAAEIAERIVAARSTIPFVAGTVAATAAARPAPFGWRVEDETTTAADALSAILGDVSTSWLLVGGAITLRPWTWSAPVVRATSFAVTRRASFRPVATRKLGYRRNWHPVSRGDLAAIVLVTDVLFADGTNAASVFAALSERLDVTAQIATGKNRTFFRATAPTSAESGEGDVWYDTSAGNQLYRRSSGTGVVAIGGSRITIGGVGITLAPWLAASDVRFETNRVAIEAAQARLTAILADGILSVDEKRQFAREWQAAQTSYAALDGKAAGFGNVTALRTALTTAYTQLAASIAAIAPAYDNFAVDSPLDRGTVEARWANYYTAFAAVDVAITAQTVIIQWSVTSAGGWHTDYAVGDKWQRQSVDGGLTFSAAQRAVGEDGAPGAAGTNTATIFLYRRATFAPAVPTAPLTYTFATTGLDGDLAGWSRTAPAGPEPLYVTAATATATTATDAIATGEWAAPVIQSRDGGQGTAGYSQATVYLYQRAAAAPARPSNILTYTFATAALAGTIDNGWSTTIPGGSNPLWITVASAYANTATDAIAAGEWSAPVIQAQDGSPGSAGAAGLNVSPVLLYQRAAAAPAVPSTATTFTFATAVLSGSLAGWTQTVPAGSAPLWITTATAAANTATDAITASEWAVPRQIAANGINVAPVTLYQRANAAPVVPTATLTYTFATSVISGSLNGWSTSVPAGTADLYVTQATALGIDAAATDTIATGEWSAPVVQAQTGQRTSFVFQRAATQPATPTTPVTPPPGWSDAPPAQTAPPLPLWQTSADFRDAARLTAWSTPIKLTAANLLDLDPVAAAVLAGKGRQFRQAMAPAAGVSQENDLWIDTSNGDALYVRRPGDVVTLAGNRVTIGGNGIVVGLWVRVGNPEAVKAAADAAAARLIAEAAVADGLLTPDEKRDLATERATIVGERDGLVARATAQGVSTVAYQAAYATLITYLDGLALGDRLTNMVINATTHTDRLATYYTARTALLSAIGDLTAANQHSLSDVADIRVTADHTGTVNGGQLPQQRSLRRYLGQADVSAQTVVTMGVSSGITATINNTAGSEQRGTVALTGLTAATGTITIMSVFNGVTLYKDFRVIRDDAPPPAGGGTSPGGGAASGNASTSSFTAPGSNTVHQVLATFAVVTTGSAGQIVVNAPLSYVSQSQGAIGSSSGSDTLIRPHDPDNPSDPGAEPVQTYGGFKAQYQIGAGAWTDLPGGETIGSGAESYFRSTAPQGDKNYPGSVSYTATATGLGSGAAVTVRLLGRMVSGTAITSVTGTAAVTPS